MTGVSQDLLKYIHRLEINTKHLVEDAMAGAYQSAFKGNGMWFEEVREYQHGDDIRSVDWNVTARMQHPYVKVFREERELTLMLIVDISASGRFGTTNTLKSQLIAEVAAVLAFSAIKNQDKVGLILFSDIVEKYIPPQKGSRHVLRIIRDLLAFTPSRKGTNIAEGLAMLGKILRRRAVCFLLSDFIDTHNYVSAVQHAAKTHDFTALMISDPAEEHIPDMGLVQFRDLETNEWKIVDTSVQANRSTFAQKAQKRRQSARQTLRYAGAGFLELSTDKPYAPLIRKYFKLRKKNT